VSAPLPPAASDATLATALLAEYRARFHAQRALAEKAAAQVDDAGMFATLDAESNSIAVVMQHVGGNLRSRFTDFLTTDGEKPDRDRDGEFLTVAGQARADVMARWEAGWRTLEHTLGTLRAEDLLRTVTIRGEPMLVVQALGRSLAHVAQHAGQVVLLAKHQAGERWQTLSIARGQSASYEAALRDGRREEPR
jgi:Protein of unknown function (DUF1572)